MAWAPLLLRLRRPFSSSFTIDFRISPPLSLSLSLSFLVDEGGKLGIGFGNGKGGLSRCFSGLLMQSLQLLALLGTTAQVVHVGAPFVVVVRCCQPASGLLDCWWAGWSVQPRGCSIGVRRVCVCVNVSSSVFESTAVEIAPTQEALYSSYYYYATTTAYALHQGEPLSKPRKMALLSFFQPSNESNAMHDRGTGCPSKFG